ncbi:hypothetical protein FN846DRAFT_984802, partial [Sphaerosporella brunnea]
MTTPEQQTPLQHALDEYSLAVQRYGQVVEQLPASLRPGSFDRFRHRGNIFAIRRRTEEVIKATKRLQKARHGPQVHPAKSATTDAVKETAQVVADAAPTAENAGYAHGSIHSTMAGVKPTGNHDTGSMQEPDTVVAQAPDTSRPLHAQMAG